jgi:membrane protein DedA with SNARE-associated domain
MREVLPFLLEHGYAVLFGVVVAEQAGAPIPALPFLLGVGALAGLGRMALVPAVVLAIVASLISDTFWYWLGRQRGSSILRVLCAISLEPDSCVSNTKNAFAKMGDSSLLVAKFVPGLSTAAPPMAGVNGMPYWRFLLMDGAGSALWAGAFLAIGYAFHYQIEILADSLTAYGRRAGFVITVLFALWIAFKLWQRERFIRSLRTARITPAEVLERMEAGCELVIVDLRHESELQFTGKRLPGARWYDRSDLNEHHHEIPRDRDVILYCS